MVRSILVAAVLGLVATVQAQCGSGSPEGTVTGEGGTFDATVGGSNVYSGSDYLAAIQTALDTIGEGQRVAVLADGSIGDGTISVGSGKSLEGCGIVDVGFRSGRGAVESLDTTGASIPYFTMTGAPYFGFRFYGVTDLSLGEITFNLSGGLAIRFDRDEAPNFGVTMGTISCTGAGSHCVETFNIDGLEIGSVIARDVGECGLLIQTSTNVNVGLVDGDNVAAGNGYATLRFANNNGQLADGSYGTNVYVDRVISRGGGRGIFCVSQSGAAEIGNIDLADNGNNAILIENCYNLSINGGVVNGGGEVRLAARDEFPNNADISISLEVNGNSVREEPCGENVSWDLTGDGSFNVC